MAWVVLLVISAAFVLVAWNADPALAVRPAATMRPEPLRVLVVFATMEGDDELLLDCIGPDGEPFTLRVEVDCNASYAAAFVESIVSKWAETGEPVALELVERADGRAVRLSGDGSRVQLPLAA